MWYYSNNGDQQGPVDEAAIPQLIANGSISAITHVWRDGLAEWQLIGQSELAGYLPIAPVVVAAPAARGAMVMTSGGTLKTSPLQSSQQLQKQNPFQQTGGLYAQPALGAKKPWTNTLFSFEGRIPRRTYWMCTLLWIGIMFGIGVIGGLLGSVTENETVAGIPILLTLIPYLWSVIALQVKRWHDRGKSGWMILVNLIPFVGGIWAFVECGCLRGTFGDNSHGPDPT